MLWLAFFQYVVTFLAFAIGVTAGWLVWGSRARKLAPKADYVYYALASVAALTGETDEAVNLLAQAIKLHPQNRFHARNDADFRLLQDEPRFLELLYPERPAGQFAREVRV